MPDKEQPPPPPKVGAASSTLSAMSTAKGHNGTVTFDGNNVIITRTGFVARMTHGKSEKRIPLRSINAIQWKDPGIVSAGFIQFTISGGSEATGMKGSRTKAAGEDENSVQIITPKEVSAMQVVRDEIQAALDAAQAPVSAAPPPTQGPPAGWYPDPHGAPVNRWWDGARWSEHTQPQG